MPYIKENQKPELDAIISKFPELHESELDYVITKLALRTLKNMPPKFVSLNKILGVLQGAAAEFYARLVAPYGRRRAAENGDIYTEIFKHFKMENETIWNYSWI